MAREEKRIELKPVEDLVTPEDTVIRLESDESSARAKPVRLSPSQEVADTSHRLNVPAREDYETRTHQPGIEALIENGPVVPDSLEHDWGKESTQHRSIPWGWFALIAIVLAGAAIWSLADVKKADEKAEKIRVDVKTVVVNDAKEEEEAAALIERIDKATRDYFRAKSTAEMLPLLRQPERVGPMLEPYYKENPIVPTEIARTRVLQPLTLDNRANFWMKSVELASGETRNLILEIMEDGTPKIDWETLVGHQPMKWDTYATTRPAGTSMDFRVYVNPDNFFSHEFANPEKWLSFRLTAMNSDETLFGYAPVGSEIGNQIMELLMRNQGMTTAMVLRLNLPEGMASRRGVIIERLVSPRWLHLDPPDTNS